jgi:hypothetical protein
MLRRTETSLKLKLLGVATFGLAGVGGAWAQDEPPVDALKGTPFEATALGRKSSLAVAADWIVDKYAATPTGEATATKWKLVGAWRSGNFAELSLRLFVAEHKGLDAATARDEWFARNKGAGVVGIEVRTVVSDPKDKTLSGFDVEFDVRHGDEKACYWIRSLTLGKDKAAVFVVEARPLQVQKSYPFATEAMVREPHVLEVRPMLASFLKRTGDLETAWRRGPKFEMTRGGSSLTFDASKNWSYTRLGPEGSVIFMGPKESKDEFIVGFQIAPDGDFKLSREAERMIVEASRGKAFFDRSLPGSDRDYEFSGARSMPDMEKILWTHRRAYVRGAFVVSTLSKVRVDSLDSAPSAEAAKATAAFFASVKVKV